MNEGLRILVLDDEQPCSQSTLHRQRGELPRRRTICVAIVDRSNTHCAPLPGARLGVIAPVAKGAATLRRGVFPGCRTITPIGPSCFPLANLGW